MSKNKKKKIKDCPECGSKLINSSRMEGYIFKGNPSSRKVQFSQCKKCGYSVDIKKDSFKREE